ncbi:sigma-70 family RNA polymerase sigma factor [Actinophytocola sp.]|uniref:RNA polymerase sigma factor n=1 Tax=Actinophytocola sp. TaxID=1872138 RepID=UPI0025B8D613|nr:sigma-70 family RNA polymerase sigma factor [Actinophytocola sp.]
MSELTEPTDAELVAGVLAGDREAFAAVYDRYADRLHDFCWSVLRDRDEAADAVQDTFVLVAQRLAQLNDPDRLRPWLYAVARSVALRKVRARQRVVLDEVGDMADTDPGPDRAAEQVALRELVWSAAAGLSERDRALLDLHVRQGLDGAELGEAMGVSANHAYVLLSRLRDQVERSLGALLIARQGRKDCTGLDALLSDWDGRYSPLMRKRVARHVDSCEVCSDRRRIMVSPFALLAAVPLLPAPVWLRDQVMDEVQLAAYEPPTAGGTPAVAPLDAGSDDSDPDPPALAARRRLRVIAAAAAVLALLVTGGAVVYLRNTPVPGEPLGLDLPIGLTTSPTGSSSGSPGSSSSKPPPTTTTTTPVPDDPTTDYPTNDDPTTEDPVDPPNPPDPPDPPGDTTAPKFGRTSASPTAIWQGFSFCDMTTSQVVAAVTDNVGVTSVVLSWSGPGEGETGSQPMSQDGDQWFGTLGPFQSPGKVSWSIAASDAAGNQTVTPPDGISVASCQVG